VLRDRKQTYGPGNKAVQEVIGGVGYYGADAGYVVTNSTFTRSAAALAQRNSIKLIDGARLREILARREAAK
jgi:restriction system protein